MNDSSEVDYGCQMFAAVLSEWRKEHQGDRSIGELVLKDLHTKFNDLTQMRHVLARIYVVCFCERPNLLSQWRTYGQSGGYSIGLSRSALEEFRTDATTMTIALEKVIYLESEQRKILQTLLVDGMPELNKPELQREFEDLTVKGRAMFLRLFGYVMELFVLREIVRFKLSDLSTPRFEMNGNGVSSRYPNPVFIPADLTSQSSSSSNPLVAYRRHIWKSGPKRNYFLSRLFGSDQL